MVPMEMIISKLIVSQTMKLLGWTMISHNAATPNRQCS